MRLSLTAASLALALAAPGVAQTQAPEAAAQPPLADLRIDESDPAAESAPTPASTPAPGPAAPALAESDRAALTASVERGRLLFALARAGQVTTRDMLSRIPDPAAAGIAGWIATIEGDGLAVTYYAEGAAGPVAVYRGRVAADGRLSGQETFSGEARPALSAFERRLAAARGAVATLDRQPCGPDFNVLPIPTGAADGPIQVYKLSPQTQRGRYPLGGHFLATVAPDGTIASTRAFANRCLDLEAGADLAGPTPRPIAVTHLLDQLPTEIHVFLSLWMNRPLLVVTGENRSWTVSRGRIGIVPPAQAATRTPPPPGPGR